MQYLISLGGGILIGISSSIILLYLGRIAGISGIFATSFLAKPNKDESWKYFFIIGLLVGGVIMKVMLPELFNYTLGKSIPLLIVSGLIVGFGTRLGGGCTSGHGVCGLPRMSYRSLVATVTFMIFGAITVFIKGLI